MTPRLILLALLGLGALAAYMLGCYLDDWLGGVISGVALFLILLVGTEVRK